MPKYILHYFNGMGRGEPVRLAFALAGVEYEDRRMQGEEWKKFKPSTPAGQMPVLEADGKMLCQSGAILRYVGAELGLNGKDIWEKAKIDEVLGITEDIMTAMLKVKFAKTDEQEQAKKSFSEKTPPLFGALEKLLAANGSGFYVGQEVTIADLFVFHVMSKVTDGNAELIADMPKVDENMKRIASIPNIKAWVQRRPKTVF